MCGTKDCVIELDRKLDYWYILSEGFDLGATQAGAELTKSLYELWDPTVHTHFRAFVEESLAGTNNE